METITSPLLGGSGLSLLDVRGGCRDAIVACCALGLRVVLPLRFRVVTFKAWGSYF